MSVASVSSTSTTTDTNGSQSSSSTKKTAAVSNGHCGNNNSSNAKHYNKGHNVVVVTPADTHGGVQRQLPLIISFMTLLAALYGGFYYAFSASNTIWGLVPAAQFCNNNDNNNDDDDNDTTTCRRPDLFAFQLASAVPMYTMALQGVYAWYVSQRPHRLLPATPQGRLWAYLLEAEHLAVVAFSYQVFDLIVSWSFPEHCTPLMMMHHTLAATVAYCSMRYQVLHYYGFFFLGLSEVSTVFLVWMDLATFFPPTTPDSLFATFIQACGPGFVVTFIWYRVLQWWPMSIQLFRDVYHVVSTGVLSKLRPGQAWVLYIFLAANLPLGLLQLYWLTIIFGEVQKTLAGE